MTTEADDKSEIIIIPIGMARDEEISTPGRPVYKVCADHDGFYQ